MNTKIGKIKDIVEEMKPPGRNNWIVVKHDPAGVPISGWYWAATPSPKNTK